MMRVMQFLSTAGGIDFAQNETNYNRMKDVPDLCTLTNMEIPVVSIVIQGGYDCARLVVDCLKRQFPVVVLRGSGGLADLLAYTYMELKQRTRDAGPWGTWDTEYVESFLKPELSNKISHHFPKLAENALARNLFRDRILECVRLAKQNNLSFLTVLNMHNYSECNLEKLSVYLLRALFKSKPRGGGTSYDYSRAGAVPLEGGPVADERLLKELYLTLDWNCPDVARDEVLVRDPGYVVRLQKDLFQTALLRPNREAFVDLFLTHGFRLHKLITPTRLRRLFKHLYHEEFFRSVCWEGVLGHSLLSKPSKYFIDTDLNWLIETCTGLDNFVNSDHLYYNVMSMYVYDAASAERKALSILTLWAVFGNRQKLAKVLWKHSDQPIHLALTISMTYDRMSWYVGETSLKNDLKEQSKQFADMATGVLEACYSEATCRAFDVLSEESPDWNFKTAVDIAANARTRSFLAHPCCQKWLTNTFLGEIRIRELSWGFLTVPAWIKILLSAFLIFPMYIWVRFKPKMTSKSEKDANDQEQDEDERDGMGNEAGGDDAGLLDNKGETGAGMAQAGANEAGAGDNRGQATPLRGSHMKANALRDREVFIRSQPPLWRMIYFMWTAPITKFWTFHIFYIFYLMLFSIAVLWPSCGNFYLDVSVCVWTALIVVEYIRRTWILYRKYTSVPLVFKCIEILLIIGFVIVYAAISIFNIALFKPYTRKVILCLALLYFYYRLIAIYLPISPTLGPMLYRLKLMVLVDFANFMRMALVLIVSGGIVMQSISYPDSELSWEVARQAFHRAWFALFLTPIEDLTADVRCKNLDFTPNVTELCFAGQYNNTHGEDFGCPTTGLWPYIFTIQYLVLLKLILMTLLYALFAATASKLNAETDAIWKYQRYILVVDFVNRLPLPAPLSIVCYLYFILRWFFRVITCYYLVRFCKSMFKSSRDKTDGITFDDSAESKYNMKMSEEDYNFWRHLAKEYSLDQVKKAEEADIQSKQWETIQSIGEEIEYEKRVLRQLKGRVTEVERMMTLSHVYLENIKHLASIKFGGGTEPETSSTSFGYKSSHHILSRQSPYPGTRVQRIPVPDKYTPWEVMWIDYDPVAYTKQKYDFPNKLQQFVDEDILLLQELQLESVRSKLPVYKWNCASTSPAGITIDRTSWCLTEDGTSVLYKLDNGIPRNPFGRTGLRGKGSQPRWGPNHYVLFIITRWQASRVPIAGGRVLEFVVEKNFPRWDQYTIPLRFVPGESLYLDLQTLFKVPPEATQWTSSVEMIDFFKNCCRPQSPSAETAPSLGEEAVAPEPSSCRCEKMVKGYMDDPFNTDHAWKEVEFWHIHYTGPDTLTEKMNSTLIGWRIISEDVFIRLPSGQSALLHEVTNKLHPAII